MSAQADAGQVPPPLDFDLTQAQQRWLPVAALAELQPRHVYHGQLLGRELAVWRADDGNVNVWENRCLHRGVRLSIGINDGRELVCQYHGWRYTNRTAQCTYIPAHPADSPARSICNHTYPVKLLHGLVWTVESALEPVVSPPINTADEPAESIAALAAPGHAAVDMDPEQLLVLRAVPVNAPLAAVVERLREYQFESALQQPASANATLQRVMNGTAILPTIRTSAVLQDPFSVVCTQSHADVCVNGASDNGSVTFFLQPVDSHRTTIRGVAMVAADCSHNDKLMMQRLHNRALCELRDVVEQDFAHGSDSKTLPAPLQPQLGKLDEASATMPLLPIQTGRQAPLRVSVAARESVADDIVAFKLVAVNSSQRLPAAQPGAHIDVHLSNGTVRQYSLINPPGETDCYRFAVKREANPDQAEAGGSAFIHDHLQCGDLLAVSLPRNNFPLRRDATHSLLIAGGIGITPLLSMAQALSHSGLLFNLHYFVQRQSQAAFAALLQSFGDSAQLEIGLSNQQSVARIGELMGQYKNARHVYFCGPGPMLSAARELADSLNWPSEAVHFEYFKNTSAVQLSSSFNVDLARSGKTLNVPAGQTLLSVLRDNGIQLPSSCEQGACGTCKVAVISGVPLHQDVYLNNTERERGDCIMACVSRAQSTSLVLDI